MQPRLLLLLVLLVLQQLSRLDNYKNDGYCQLTSN